MKNVGVKDKNHPHQLSIWMTTEDRDALFKMAAADDRSMSSFIRKIIREKIKKQKGMK